MLCQNLIVKLSPQQAGSIHQLQKIRYLDPLLALGYSGPVAHLRLGSAGYSIDEGGFPNIWNSDYHCSQRLVDSLFLIPSYCLCTGSFNQRDRILSH